MTTWSFTDGSSTYNLPVGPSSLTISYQKELAYDWQLDTSSTSVMMLKNVGRPTAEINGTLITEAQYTALVGWYQSGSLITITDYVGRQIEVRIKDLELSRVRSSVTPWKHTWRMALQVIGVVNP